MDYRAEGIYGWPRDVNSLPCTVNEAGNRQNLPMREITSSALRQRQIVY